MSAQYTLKDARDLLLLPGASSFLLVGKANSDFPLVIATCNDEYSQTLEADDLVAVSAPEGGSIETAVVLLEMVRHFRLPLVVLPGGHPASRRLKYVVSAGPEIHLNCGILRGTHPEQHLICASEELAGIFLEGIPGGIRVNNLPGTVIPQILDALLNVNLSTRSRGDRIGH